MLIYYAGIITSLLCLTDSANILYIALTPAFSHQIFHQAVWKELSLKGHQVHVITPNPLRDPSLTNLTEIDVSSLYDFMKANIKSGVYKYSLFAPQILLFPIKEYVMADIVCRLMEHCLSDENVQAFFKEEHNFDVAVVEWVLFTPMSVVSLKYNCPLIGITSQGMRLTEFDTVGNPAHLAFTPDNDLPLPKRLSFLNRVVSVIYNVYIKVLHQFYVLPQQDTLIRKYFGNDLPYLGEITQNVSLLLLNSNPIFHRIYPKVPAVIELGGGIQLQRNNEELDLELKAFLDSSKRGVLYFSLGSSLKSSIMPENIRNILTEVFSRVPYDVVWKWEEGDLPGKPNNVLSRKWLPQNALLGHSNLKLFITQGGIQSLEDAIRNHVPIIGIPLVADQTTNVDICVEHGLGLTIDIGELTAHNLNVSIYTIMENREYYARNAAKLDGLLQDTPMDGLTKAVWWIEYVIRNRGAKHLESPFKNISWIQYYMVDVLAFLIVFVLCTIYVTYKVIGITMTILRFVKRCANRNKIGEDKKNK